MFTPEPENNSVLNAPEFPTLETSANDKSTDSNGEINNFNFMLTNARSLAPKLDSFIESFNERNIDLCVITKTWLQDNMGILMGGDVALSLGEGIGVVHQGQPTGMRGGCLLYTSPSPRD